MDAPLYLSIKSLAERFEMSDITIRRRIDEMKDEGIYGKNAVIYDGVIRAFLPAVIHYMRNRKFLSRKNMRKFVPAYDPDEIIRELALNEWGAEPVKQPELDKELVKELLREVLREGIAL